MEQAIIISAKNFGSPARGMTVDQFIAAYKDQFPGADLAAIAIELGLLKEVKAAKSSLNTGFKEDTTIAE